MAHPFQRLSYSPPNSSRSQGVIFAASGPKILSFSALDGSFLSEWSAFPQSTSLKRASNEDQEHIVDNQSAHSRSSKKRLKLFSGSSHDTSLEVIIDNGGKKPKPKTPKAVLLPSVIRLCGTSDGEHIIALTGEDKCVRVFNVSHDGSLTQLSERHMPKKPISITLTTNQSIILCADKFGDVYSLPLFESLVKNTRQVDGFSKLGKTENTPAKPFTPSATALTVHTKSNQEALQHQQRVSNKAPEKNKLDFDHQLLLGHVSLLIDVVYVTLKTDLPELSRSRDYILTSDRDEHIRVSRGLRQAHIIEGYCLGHSQFVSKLCIPPWRQELLLSGGGDDYLLVWDWVSGVVRQKVDLAAHVATVKATFDRTTPVTGASKPLDSACGTRSEETALIAVSGIWAVQPASEESSGEVVVSIEGIPALLIFSLSTEGVVFHRQNIVLEGNLLDVATCDRNSIIYSMDNAHRPLTRAVTDIDGTRPVIGTYGYGPDHWSREGPLVPTVDAINQWSLSQRDLSQAGETKPVVSSELLYSIESLRKRAGQED